MPCPGPVAGAGTSGPEGDGTGGAASGAANWMSVGAVAVGDGVKDGADCAGVPAGEEGAWTTRAARG